MNLAIMILGLAIFAHGVYSEIQGSRSKAHDELMTWVKQVNGLPQTASMSIKNGILNWEEKP